MEQAGPRSRQATAESAPDAAATRPASAYRVPAQPGVADVDRERGIAADGTAAAVRGDTGPVIDAARGEHTHSETPIPLPRTQGRPVVQRSSVRGQILDALRAALAGGELTPGRCTRRPRSVSGSGSPPPPCARRCNNWPSRARSRSCPTGASVSYGGAPGNWPSSRRCGRCSRCR